MTRLEQVESLCNMLLEEMPEYRESAAGFGDTVPEQRRLLRSLMNVRPPAPLDGDFLRLQDELLSTEREEKGVVHPDSIPCIAEGIKLWRGDITRLAADAIVNAANSKMLGCFVPCHGCIDNAIHSAAGLQLRQECAEIMRRQKHDEPAGTAKITGAYNLPSRYVLHTVGPIVRGTLTDREREQLADCYRSCLRLAEERGLRTAAFCCISTGEFGFPQEEAARIAVETVRDCRGAVEVIFNVFKERDEELYRRILAP